MWKVPQLIWLLQLLWARAWWSEDRLFVDNLQFHQYDSTFHFYFETEVIQSTRSTILFSFLSPCCLWNIKSQVLRWRCQIIWIVEDCRGSSFPSRWSFTNVSCKTPNHSVCHAAIQNRSAAKFWDLDWNSRRSIGNVGRSRTALPDSGS